MENEPKRAGAGLHLAQLNLNRPEFQPGEQGDP